eukprot:scaffold931_cov383-Prasinococcus_capsulatus_cf.AAC.14
MATLQSAASARCATVRTIQQKNRGVVSVTTPPYAQRCTSSHRALLHSRCACIKGGMRMAPSPHALSLCLTASPSPVPLSSNTYGAVAILSRVVVQRPKEHRRPPHVCGDKSVGQAPRGSICGSSGGCLALSDSCSPWRVPLESAQPLHGLRGMDSKQLAYCSAPACH